MQSISSSFGVTANRLCCILFSEQYRHRFQCDLTVLMLLVVLTLAKKHPLVVSFILNMSIKSVICNSYSTDMRVCSIVMR